MDARSLPLPGLSVLPLVLSALQTPFSPRASYPTQTLRSAKPPRAQLSS